MRARPSHGRGGHRLGVVSRSHVASAGRRATKQRARRDGRRLHLSSVRHRSRFHAATEAAADAATHADRAQRLLSRQCDTCRLFIVGRLPRAPSGGHAVRVRCTLPNAQRLRTRDRGRVRSARPRHRVMRRDRARGRAALRQVLVAQRMHGAGAVRGRDCARSAHNSRRDLEWHLSYGTLSGHRGHRSQGTRGR